MPAELSIGGRTFRFVRDGEDLWIATTLAAEDWTEAKEGRFQERFPFRARLPDLLVEWSEERALGSATVGTGRGARVRLVSDRIGTVEGTNAYCRSGDHRRGGLFVAVGPTLQPGRMTESVSIMDFAPTLARLLGVELPPVAGRPIGRLLARG